MKLVLNLSSFRFRIILALILIITTISFLSFYMYNHYLSQRIYKNAQEGMVTSMSLLRDHIINVHDGRIIKSCLKTMETNKKVWRTYLINSEGKVVYPENPGHVSRSLLTTDLKSLPEDITIQNKGSNNFKYGRAIMRMKNGKDCYSCHSPLKPVIGYIVVDYSLNESADTIVFARNSSILFTMIMLILILGFVFFLHYRFVKKSLFQFRSTINIINSGDLDQRIRIPSSKELGELGTSFNMMVEHFQFTQKELARYHEKEIRNSQKLASIGEMSARLAHEIRNPVTGIVNAVEIIIDETKNGQNKTILEEIRRQATRVNKAVSNLLRFSQTKELNIQKENINEIIKSVVFFLENQSVMKNIHFEMNLDPQLPAFYFDPEQIENVLLNLGMNAVQASDMKGAVIYSTLYDPLKNMVTISVKDTGRGIPAEIMEDIFTPFYTTRTEGTGLGLAIVKDIVEMHKGTIVAKNNPDKGCTFSISLNTNFADVEN